MASNVASEPSSPFCRADRLAFAGLTLAYVLMHGAIALGVPDYEPAVHNDDWVNSLVVRELCNGDGLRLHRLAGAFALPQIVAGWAWCQATGGFSFTALRTLMVWHGVIPVWLLWFWLRRLRVPRVPALFGGLLFCVNPLTVSLIWSFQTDVVYLSFLLAALLLTSQADVAAGRSGTEPGSGLARTAPPGPAGRKCLGGTWLVLAATALLLLAFLTRQSAVFVTVGVAGYWGLRRRWPWAACTLAVVPLMLLAEKWLIRQNELTYLPWVKSQLMRSLGDWSLGRLIYCSYETLHALVFLGLLLLPLLVLARPKPPRGGRLLTACAFLLVAGIVLLNALVQRSPLPGNYIYVGDRWGVGPATLELSPASPAGVTRGGSNSVTFTFLSLAAWIGGGLLLQWCCQSAAVLVRVMKKWTCESVFLAELAFWASLAGMLASSVLIGRPPFDRYVWFLYPLAMPLVLRRDVPGRRWLTVCGPLVVMLAAVSYVGVVDYWRWNQARWEAVAWLESQGVAPERIDGGYEYNAMHDMLAVPQEMMTAEDRTRQAAIVTARRGQAVYVLRFSPRPQEAVAARFSYATPRCGEKQHIWVIRSGSQPEQPARKLRLSTKIHVKPRILPAATCFPGEAAQSPVATENEIF